MIFMLALSKLDAKRKARRRVAPRGVEPLLTG